MINSKLVGKSLPEIIHMNVFGDDRILKWGITNRDPEIRLREQSNAANLKGKQIFCIEGEGNHIAEIESLINHNFTPEKVDKVILPDGHSEAMEYSHSAAKRLEIFVRTMLVMLQGGVDSKDDYIRSLEQLLKENGIGY